LSPEQRLSVRIIGSLSSDGTAAIDRNLVEIPSPSVPHADEQAAILARIRNAGEVGHSNLLRSLSYKLDAKRISKHLDKLIRMGAVEKLDGGKGRRYRIVTAEASSDWIDVAVPAEFKLSDADIVQQLKNPIRTLPPNIWGYRNLLLQVVCGEYLIDENIGLYIKRYVLEREKEVEGVRMQVELLEKMASGNFSDQDARRIPEHVRMYVWQRDEGKCAACASTQQLEFDHIIPVSKGGSSTERNVQLLCGPCNRKKSAKISVSAGA
jgi:DNA-binding transcriptional ArsR family regulator